VEATDNTLDAAVEKLFETPEAHPEEAATEEVEIETTEAEDAEVDEIDTEEEADAEEAEATEDDETEEVDATEEPTAYTVKVDGVEQTVTLDELTKSYSGQGYIQKGMQEAAAQKKEAESVYNALQQERANLAQLHKQLQESGVSQAPTMPDHALAMSDPIAYTQEMAQYNAAKTIHDAQSAQFSQVAEQQTQAQQVAQQAYQGEQQRILVEAIPALADPEKAPQLKADLLSAGNHYGFSSDELGGVVDARTIQVLHDAMRYRQLQSGKAVQKVVKARPVTKPKAKRTISKSQKTRQDQTARLRQSGSIDDALNLLFE
jgi:hypothetical protein